MATVQQSEAPNCILFSDYNTFSYTYLLTYNACQVSVRTISVGIGESKHDWVQSSKIKIIVLILKIRPSSSLVHTNLDQISELAFKQKSTVMVPHLHRTKIPILGPVLEESKIRL